MLTDDDKDKYLVERLIGKKWYTGGILGAFLTDRMIVAIFLEISSRKKNRQLLNDAVINKLVLLSDSFKNVRNLLYENRSNVNIVNKVHFSWKPNKDLNSIEKNLSTKISQIFDRYESNH